MDDLSAFIQKTENEIDGIQPGSLQAGTRFRELPEWSSMHALILIALAETEYDVSIKGEELRRCTTLEDVYQLIKSRS